MFAPVLATGAPHVADAEHRSMSARGKVDPAGGGVPAAPWERSHSTPDYPRSPSPMGCPDAHGPIRRRPFSWAGLLNWRSARSSFVGGAGGQLPQGGLLRLSSDVSRGTPALRYTAADARITGRYFMRCKLEGEGAASSHGNEGGIHGQRLGCCLPRPSPRRGE